MRVRLLGTGSADGWPNAFCDCAACRSASTLRSPTSALVDGTLLLDCGPETPRAALRHAGGLGAVTHLLITSDHPGRSNPLALLARTGSARREPLTVVGPPAVVASWSEGVEPASPVSFTAVAAGDSLVAGNYLVRVLAAADDQAVLYDVTGPSGTRLLYATDTGPLPDRTRVATAGAAYDLVLAEAAFGDRDDLAAELRHLRVNGAVTDDTTVVAVHLSHHSPPDLERRLARWGARVVDDGTELVLGPGADRAAPHRTAPHRPAPRRTLVLGGARSGKSATAERLLQADPAVTYLAAGAAPDDTDPEWSARVQVHRDRRPTGWTTTETTDVAGALRAARQPVLLDSVGTWLTAVLDQAGAWDQREGWRAWVDREVTELVAAWRAAPITTVAVSDEVGAGVVPATASGRLFRDELGRLNSRLAEESERVLLVVAGREIDLSRLEDRA